MLTTQNPEKTLTCLPYLNCRAFSSLPNHDDLCWEHDLTNAVNAPLTLTITF